MISKIKQQGKDLVTELKRVEWPPKDKVTGSTAAVVFVSLFFGAFFYGVDFVIERLMKLLMHS